MSAETQSEEKVEPQSGASSGASKDKNPCGMCRAAGMPVCKGHGGGSGGGGGGGSSKSEELPSQGISMQSRPMPQFQGAASKNLSIDEMLAQSSLWSQSDPSELNFQYNNPNSLISIELKMENLVLTFRGHDRLTTEQQKARDEFFMAVEQEFKLFKQELSTSGVSCEQMTLNRTANQLSIMIPSPKYYDVFLERLMDKNLLNTQALPEPTLAERKETQEVPIVDHVDQDSTSRSTAPNPFQTTLKPKGWDD